MHHTLRIIHLEDLKTDAEIVERALKKSNLNYELCHAENKEQFIIALDTFKPDMVLSDHSLPGFDSHEALKIVRSQGLDIPFILVTATVSEEYAVTVIKDGASDYILKDRLQRLPNAIEAAVEKYSTEVAIKESLKDLRVSERKYKLLFEANPLPMLMISKATLDIITVNEAAINHYGYSHEEFIKLNASSLRISEDQEVNPPKNDEANKQGRIWRQVKKDGTVIMAEIIEHDVIYEGQPAVLVLANDVTEKLKAQEALVDQRMHQQKLISETSIQVQEKERDEIGKELHDHINQVLATANLYLQMGLKKTGIKSEHFDKSQEYILMAIEEIRKLSHNLVAPSLGQISIEEAVHELIMNVQSTTSLKVSLDMGNFIEDTMEHNMKLMFYRVIQEQISNILKHAQATNVEIRFEANSSTLKLFISDNGKGFDITNTTDGIGLKNIKNRAEFYDGTTRIQSSPGEGCRLELIVPINNTRARDAH